MALTRNGGEIFILIIQVPNMIKTKKLGFKKSDEAMILREGVNYYVGFPFLMFDRI